MKVEWNGEPWSEPLLVEETRFLCVYLSFANMDMDMDKLMCMSVLLRILCILDLP